MPFPAFRFEDVRFVNSPRMMFFEKSGRFLRIFLVSFPHKHPPFIGKDHEISLHDGRLPIHDPTCTLGYSLHPLGSDRFPSVICSPSQTSTHHLSARIMKCRIPLFMATVAKFYSYGYRKMRRSCRSRSATSGVSKSCNSSSWDPYH